MSYRLIATLGCAALLVLACKTASMPGPAANLKTDENPLQTKRAAIFKSELVDLEGYAGKKVQIEVVSPVMDDGTPYQDGSAEAGGVSIVFRTFANGAFDGGEKRVVPVDEKSDGQTLATYFIAEKPVIQGGKTRWTVLNLNLKDVYLAGDTVYIPASMQGGESDVSETNTLTPPSGAALHDLHDGIFHMVPQGRIADILQETIAKDGPG